jgi:hypothetical protein
MRLFKSNKSQGSLQNNQSGKSPLNSPVDSPLQSPAFPPPPSAAYGPSALQHDGAADPSDSQRYYPSDEAQAHPAHIIPRSQSQSTQGHGYQGRPIVNVIPDQVDENHPDGRQPAISSLNQEETRQKKHSKRSLFGLHSSKDTNPYPPTNTSSLGRSLSTRKKVATPRNQEETILQALPPQYSGEGYASDTREGAESSSEYLPAQTNTELDEQYYRQLNNLDSPESQTSHYSTQYQHEETRQEPQQTPYRSHQPQRSNSSIVYHPYHPQQDRPSLDTSDPYRAIRPPSQQSLGPPSPVASLQQSNEARPSTAPARQSNQSGQYSHFQPQVSMARDSNPSMRQQMAQQQQQQHQQGMEQAHGQYGAPGSGRQHTANMEERGRNTPPPSKSRDDYNTLDYQTLLQKHEELRMHMPPLFFLNHD